MLLALLLLLLLLFFFFWKVDFLITAIANVYNKTYLDRAVRTSLKKPFHAP